MAQQRVHLRPESNQFAQGLVDNWPLVSCDGVNEKNLRPVEQGEGLIESGNGIRITELAWSRRVGLRLEALRRLLPQQMPQSGPS